MEPVHNYLILCYPCPSPTQNSCIISTQLHSLNYWVKYTKPFVSSHAGQRDLKAIQKLSALPNTTLLNPFHFKITEFLLNFFFKKKIKVVSSSLFQIMRNFIRKSSQQCTKKSLLITLSGEGGKMLSYSSELQPSVTPKAISETQVSSSICFWEFKITVTEIFFSFNSG